MGYDPVQGVATYGARCLDGTARQFAWWMRTFVAGSLGCYNPASTAGGGPSLHAEGRAMDIALNANDPAERARGFAIFELVMAHPDWFGAQEMLFAGYIWSWRRRSEGKRGPGIQQAPHMNHVHLGIDVDAAQHWTEAWVRGGTRVPPSTPPFDYAAVKRQVALIALEDPMHTLITAEGRGIVVDNGRDLIPLSSVVEAENWKRRVVAYGEITMTGPEYDNFKKARAKGVPYVGDKIN